MARTVSSCHYWLLACRSTFSGIAQRLLEPTLLMVNCTAFHKNHRLKFIVVGFFCLNFLFHWESYW